jgi:hypothetical protein
MVNFPTQIFCIAIFAAAALCPCSSVQAREAGRGYLSPQMLCETFCFGSAWSWVWQSGEPSFPLPGPGVEGCSPDLLLKDWEGGREGRKGLFVDVVGSSSLAVSNMEGFVPGGASRRAVARNEASYMSRHPMGAAPFGHVLLIFF